MFEKRRDALNKSESKYFNTAVRMDEALILLMEKKEFTYITIKEICECAGVNRSTFYLHYENMGDLLAEALEHMNAGFMDYFETDTQSVLDKKRLFSAALNRPESFQSHLVFEKMASDLFRPIMSRFCLPEEEQDYDSLIPSRSKGGVYSSRALVRFCIKP